MKVLGQDEIDDPVAPATKKPRVISSLADPAHHIEAVHIFSEVGSLAETSRRTGLSILELSRMSREPWWQRELAGIQREQTALENVRLTSMWGRTLEQMGEMLDKGVPIITRNGPLLDEDGQQIYGKLRPNELAKFAEVLFTQRQLVRELPTAIMGSNSKLEELADKLATLGKARAAKVIEADVTDVSETRDE